MTALIHIVCTLAFIALVSSRSMTMMASKYLGKSPVFIAGGSNGVGLEVLKQLSSMGTPVHVLARREVRECEVIHLDCCYYVDHNLWIGHSSPQPFQDCVSIATICKKIDFRRIYTGHLYMPTFTSFLLSLPCLISLGIESWVGEIYRSDRDYRKCNGWSCNPEVYARYVSFCSLGRNKSLLYDQSKLVMGDKIDSDGWDRIYFYLYSCLNLVWEVNPSPSWADSFW